MSSGLYQIRDKDLDTTLDLTRLKPYGDTMNDGEIVIHGSCGDAAGYAMRGGRIFVRGNVGYRAGIHMKAYQDRKSVV